MSQLRVRTSDDVSTDTAAVTVDLSAWYLLVDLLTTELPEFPVPAAFRMPPGTSLHRSQRAAAWRHLTQLRIARPGADQPRLDALSPAVVAGLTLLGMPGVRARVSATLGGAAVTQVVAWNGYKAIALSRRRRWVTGPDGTPTAEVEPAVRLTLLTTTGVLAQVLSAVPPTPSGRDAASRSAANGTAIDDDDHDGPARDVPPAEPAPVTMSWPMSVALARALREGRDDVARHLGDLSPEKLATVGDATTRLTGAVDVTVTPVDRAGVTPGADRVTADAGEVAPEPDSGTPGATGAPRATTTRRGIWLLTEDGIVQLATVTHDEVTLRPTTRERLEDDILTALTTVATGLRPNTWTAEAGS